MMRETSDPDFELCRVKMDDCLQRRNLGYFDSKNGPETRSSLFAKCPLLT